MGTIYKKTGLGRQGVADRKCKVERDHGLWCLCWLVGGVDPGASLWWLPLLRFKEAVVAVGLCCPDVPLSALDMVFYTVLHSTGAGFDRLVSTLTYRGPKDKTGLHAFLLTTVFIKKTDNKMDINGISLSCYYCGSFCRRDWGVLGQSRKLNRLEVFRLFHRAV